MSTPAAAESTKLTTPLFWLALIGLVLAVGARGMQQPLSLRFASVSLLWLAAGGSLIRLRGAAQPAGLNREVELAAIVVLAAGVASLI